MTEAELLEKLTDQAFEIGKLKSTLKSRDWFIKAQRKELAILRAKVEKPGKKK